MQGNSFPPKYAKERPAEGILARLRFCLLCMMGEYDDPVCTALAQCGAYQKLPFLHMIILVFRMLEF